LSWFIKPITPRHNGTPTTTLEFEFDTNLKKLSEGKLFGELIALRILISMFWGNKLADKNKHVAKTK
jgi:hypothetical protein